MVSSERLLFVASVVYAAVLLRPVPGSTADVNLAFATFLAVLGVVLESRLRETPVTSLLGALLGGAVGLVIARTIGSSLFWADTGDRRVAFLHSFVLLVLPYLGVVIGGKQGEWLEPARLVGLFRAKGPERRYKILDTSVIIDGRIADVCETGFLGRHARPPAVRPERIAARGRFGRLAQAQPRTARSRHSAEDPEDVRRRGDRSPTPTSRTSSEVDLKLIELARTLRGEIVTNDFNLNKVAQLRGVEVLNINELANALKPVVLPGEIMKVFILKEGKEYNQGVAYLDDGTMVVVDNARRMISRTIDIVVTSVLQTTAGKMIFGRFIDPSVAAQGATRRRERS